MFRKDKQGLIQRAGTSVSAAVQRRLAATFIRETTTQIQVTVLQEAGQMGVRMHLLPAAWLCALLAVQGHSCPDTCNKCSGPENDQCEECRAGWTLHNNTCVDIDECGTKLGNCPSNTYCFNTEGSFECKGCDSACVGCMGSGPARCRKCASGYRLTGSKCLDMDECSDRVLACPGLDQICTNTVGSFRCDCANGFIPKGGVCVKKHRPNDEEKGLFEDIQDDEVEVLQQMFFGVVLCALATLAAKGDMVYTSVFMGAVAAMAGYWLSDRADRFLQGFIKGR
ncbi:cysteine-rich with EGF-like domain protein 1 [Echeneis naucrates]|uniref:cysteine-rich with EGF-like domain protein 1 n=1 Tax=Echeneis naucrates TaxID=173247 RepID=UPI001113BEAF|nr:cysteine-rich with EGF-like domain protein 1 [Echeneis naucrates]